MTSEYDKRILILTNQILELLVSKVKDQFLNHFKNVFPLWYFSMSDPTKDIAKSAKNAYKLLFSKKKSKRQKQNVNGFLVAKNEYLDTVIYFLNRNHKDIKEENSILSD